MGERIQNIARYGFFKYWFLYSLLLTVIFFSSAVGVFSFLIKNKQRQFFENRMLQVKRIQERINSHFLAVQSDLLFLPHLNEVDRFMDNPGERERQELEQIFLAFARSKRYYQQLRILDNQGMEMIRINNYEGFISVVRQEDLQYKGEQNYFREARNYLPGHIYVSSLELNQEQGEVERPFRETLRFVVPLYSGKGNVAGMLVLNYQAYNILEELKFASRHNPGVFGLLGQHGYWLFNDNPCEEWGFMFPDDPARRSLQEKDPVLWSKIQLRYTGPFHHKGQLYTVTFVKPLHSSLSYYRGPEWLLVTHTDLGELGLAREDRKRVGSFILLFSFLGAVILALIFAHLRTQRNAFHHDLFLAAWYDPLTTLSNRALLKIRGEQAVAEALRYEHWFALLFIDLDGFKVVNDTYGHKEGDLLLQQVASRLLDCVRDTDTVSRLGGDEFTILLHSINDKKDAARIAREILNVLSREFELSHGKVTIGASIGIATMKPGEDSDLDTLLRNADAAMYEVKKEGKGSYKFF